MTTAWVGGTILVVGGTALGLRALRKHALSGPNYKGLPPPPQGAGITACSMPKLYPGFVLKNGFCTPGPTTPAGIYVLPDCHDFVFVAGDEGDQVHDLEARVDAAVTASSNAASPSVDPTTIVTAFFHKYWPRCPWPPPGNAPSRIVQLYMALSVVIGRTILQNGGRVLGTVLSDLVDEQLAERFGELGLPDFDPSVVPEIELPEVEYGPVQAQPLIPLPQGGAGPGQGGGVIGPQNVPGQGLAPAPGKPGVAKPPKKCQTTPYAPPTYRNHDLPAASWVEESHQDIKIFDFGVDGFSDCKEWTLRFGLCLWPTSGQLYGSLNPENPQPNLIFNIRNEDNSAINWSQFTWSPLFKRQYKLKVALVNGAATLVPDSVSHAYDAGVDPCIGTNQVWPTPSPRYIVLAAWKQGLTFRNTPWQPTPYVTWVGKGKKFYARVHYVGMPQFLIGGADPAFGGIDVSDYPSATGQGVAAAGQTTSFRMDYKVWGIGGWK